MRPDKRFLKQPKSFWATIRSLSEKVGYSKRGKIIIPTPEEMDQAFIDLELDSTTLAQKINDIMEEKILLHPAEYLWIHRRFKSTLGKNFYK